MLSKDLGEALTTLSKTIGSTAVVVDVIVNGRIETHEIKTVSIIETVALDGSVISKNIRVNMARVGSV